MKRVTQFGTVAFALCMMAAYVVYSQRQQNHTIAPGSKSAVMTIATNEAAGAMMHGHLVTTNGRSNALLFPGSKSLTPVVKLPEGASATSSPAWIPHMTSKFGTVFTTSAPASSPNATAPSNAPTTAIEMPATKTGRTN